MSERRHGERGTDKISGRLSDSSRPLARYRVLGLFTSGY